MSDVVKAVVFDVDGTLLDTTEFIYQAFEHTFRRHDVVPVSREELFVHMGTPLERVYELVAPHHDANVLSVTHREFQRDNPQLLRLYPGVTEMLEWLKSKGIWRAAVTSRKQSATESLEKVGLLHGLLEIIVTGNDVKQHKPDPEGIVKALAAMEMVPEQSLMVGDTPSDIEAGRNAKVAATVGVTYGFYGKQIAASHPDYVIDSAMELLELPVFA